MNMLRELNDDRQLVFGKHAGYNAWTDGKKHIWFDINTFRKWTKGKPSRNIFYLRAMHTFAHELAHGNDNRDKDHHGYYFDEQWIEKIKELMNKAEQIITSEKGVK
jgi:flavorubredoxin